jgi:hypothetical protein
MQAPHRACTLHHSGYMHSCAHAAGAERSRPLQHLLPCANLGWALAHGTPAAAADPLPTIGRRSRTPEHAQPAAPPHQRQQTLPVAGYAGTRTRLPDPATGPCTAGTSRPSAAQPRGSASRAAPRLPRPSRRRERRLRRARRRRGGRRAARPHQLPNQARRRLHVLERGELLVVVLGLRVRRPGVSLHARGLQWCAAFLPGHAGVSTRAEDGEASWRARRCSLTPPAEPAARRRFAARAGAGSEPARAAGLHDAMAALHAWARLHAAALALGRADQVLHAAHQRAQALHLRAGRGRARRRGRPPRCAGGAAARPHPRGVQGARVAARPGRGLGCTPPA